MRNSALLDFCYFLESTELNAAIQANFWIVPTMQTLHILAMASVLIGALLINLRILSLHAKSEPIANIITRYKSLVWFPLPILLITGCIMIVGEPARSLTNPAFQIKMVMLLAVLFITFFLQRKWQKDHSYAQTDVISYPLAMLSLGLWVGIVSAGRWIAYV